LVSLILEEIITQEAEEDNIEENAITVLMEGGSFLMKLSFQL
jgi:hypothetical protein